MESNMKRFYVIRHSNDEFSIQTSPLVRRNS